MLESTEEKLTIQYYFEEYRENFESWIKKTKWKSISETEK